MKPTHLEPERLRGGRHRCDCLWTPRSHHACRASLAGRSIAAWLALGSCLSVLSTRAVWALFTDRALDARLTGSPWHARPASRAVTEQVHDILDAAVELLNPLLNLLILGRHHPLRFDQVVLSKDFEKGYKKNTNKSEKEFAFYK